MKKFWKKHKEAILAGVTFVVVGLKIGSKYHEPVQKGFNGVSSAGRAAGTTVKNGATQACGYVKGLFSSKSTESNEV